MKWNMLPPDRKYSQYTLALTPTNVGVASFNASSTAFLWAAGESSIWAIIDLLARTVSKKIGQYTYYTYILAYIKFKKCRHHIYHRFAMVGRSTEWWRRWVYSLTLTTCILNERNPANSTRSRVIWPSVVTNKQIFVCLIVNNVF